MAEGDRIKRRRKMIAPSGETCALVMQVVLTEPHGRNVGLDSFKDIGESEEEVGSRQGGGTGSCVPLSLCGSTIQHRSVIWRCACYSRKAIWFLTCPHASLGLCL